MGTNDRRPPYTNDRNRQPQPPLQGEVLPPKRAQRVDPASLGLRVDLRITSDDAPTS